MKHLLIAATVLFAAPAQAYQILPTLYARTFCEMRQLGLSKADANKAAVQAGVIDGDDAPLVMVGGRLVRTDALIAVRYIDQMCPEMDL